MSLSAAPRPSESVPLSSESEASDSSVRADSLAADGDGLAAAGSSSSWFGGDLFGKRFYEGPFEDTMTRREAALRAAAVRARPT